MYAPVTQTATVLSDVLQAPPPPPIVEQPPVPQTPSVLESPPPPPFVEQNLPSSPPKNKSPPPSEASPAKIFASSPVAVEQTQEAHLTEAVNVIQAVKTAPAENQQLLMGQTTNLKEDSDEKLLNEFYDSLSAATFYLDQNNSSNLQVKKEMMETNNVEMKDEPTINNSNMNTPQ